MYAAAIGRTDYAHLVVWRRVYPDKPIPKGWTADHLCRVTLCQRPDLLERVTRAENTRRRHHRPPVEYGSTHIPSTSRTFAIALFAAIHRPSIDARSLSLDELIDLLSAFQVLEDKHRGRCRSPTRYADGARQCRRARGERAGVRSGPGPARLRAASRHLLARPHDVVAPARGATVAGGDPSGQAGAGATYPTVPKRRRAPSHSTLTTLTQSTPRRTGLVSIGAPAPCPNRHHLRDRLGGQARSVASGIREQWWPAEGWSSSCCALKSSGILGQSQSSGSQLRECRWPASAWP